MKRIFGIAYHNSFYPGLTKVPSGWSLLKHPCGYTFSMPNRRLAFTVVKNKGKWHFIKGTNTQDNFYKLTFMNASTREEDLTSDPVEIYNKAAIEKMIADEFIYDARKDPSTIDLIPIKPVTGERWDYTKDPDYYDPYGKLKT